MIAREMVAQSVAWGLSVIEIACAPTSSVPFWEAMGFTAVPSRQGHGGGVYAFREIGRPLAQGCGRRVPYVIRFYSEDARRRGGAPFRVREGEGEMRRERRLRLAERAACYGPEIHDLPNCYVEIEVGGRRLFHDKTKREEAAAVGVEVDRGYVPFVETILLPSL